MILTCPACGTRYVVKDGAIPPGGRQVRCASCKHSWHQDEQVVDEGSADEAFGGTAPTTQTASGIEDRSSEAERADYAHSDEAPLPEEVAEDPDSTPLPEPQPPFPAGSTIVTDEATLAASEQFEAEAPAQAFERDPSAAPVADGGWNAPDEDYSPFAARDAYEEPRRRGLLYLLVALLLIAIAAAAIWFLAPPQWKQRLGIAGATGETPLLLQVEQHSRQQLASGNQLLEVSGRVINPTDEAQRVPPLQAQLRSLEQKVVYRWTIPPPAPVLAPGGSATFNSAELNIPPTAACLDVSFGNATKQGGQQPCRATPPEGPTAAG